MEIGARRTIDPAPAIKALAAIVREQEQNGHTTTMLAHLRASMPRGLRTRLTPTSGPLGLCIRADLAPAGRYRVIVQYQTAELRQWVDEQLELLRGMAAGSK